MTLALRRYSHRDCAPCWTLFHAAVQIGAAAHYDQAQRNAWSPGNPAPNAANCARLDNAITWLAHTSEGTLAGFMSLERDGHLDMAFVAPEQMRRGVASALHGAVLSSAHDLSLPRLHTEASHLARLFLLRHGWRVITPETITRNGVALDRFRMALSLETTP